LADCFVGAQLAISGAAVESPAVSVAYRPGRFQATDLVSHRDSRRAVAFLPRQISFSQT
jgi:hypothetical protein